MNLNIGQMVNIFGDCPTLEGKVTKVDTRCIYVESPNGQRLRFNLQGKECDSNGRAYDDTPQRGRPSPLRIAPQRELDIKTLVVGQNVFIRSGRYSDWGKVLEITPTGVCVEHIYEEPTPEWTPYDRAIRFDKNGTACESCGYKGRFVEGSKIPGTKDGPWKLYASPAEAGLATVWT